MCSFTNFNCPLVSHKSYICWHSTPQHVAAVSAHLPKISTFQKQIPFPIFLLLLYFFLPFFYYIHSFCTFKNVMYVYTPNINSHTALCATFQKFLWRKFVRLKGFLLHCISAKWLIVASKYFLFVRVPLSAKQRRSTSI